ncbi:BlaI/MecI/CopY family transcriptional regulator [Anaerocolumna sp. AGMB13025]|uniref:BlaI/MecI/CopY family transcriptional regulator n=1 Tax=Anaerocolumna sp. AGMB13025 TaxID=3039116 RepID=UPI00241FD3B7|nr:BlaI/MecI/CopY family transcriptional regulator [Anaerocolumna sp. AGMB13025]WFR57158.1 BlaI/MecI/CopY family transcriptional regulator [Anaerocolumna sp. AGMB13025]
MENLKIFDAEYRFMCIVWEKEPINSTELVKLCQSGFGWKKSTTYSVIKRLSERGMLKNENAVVTSLVKRIQVQKYESEQILEKAFDNSLPSFITAFLQDKKLTQEEAGQIKKMIEEATK